MFLFRRKPKEAWGVWSPSFGEWLNQGLREPYFTSQREAERALGHARMHYSMGQWEVRRYPLDQEEGAEPTLTQPSGGPTSRES